jgi:hypothetical protein
MENNAAGGRMEYWEKIVLLHPNGPSTKALSIQNSKDAARILLKAWPSEGGKSYRRAVLNCSAAVHGRVPSDLAQWSFVVALMEAAISYEITDRLDAEIGAVCRELMIEDASLYQDDASTAEDGDVTQPFWWPKRQASGPSAR